MNLNDFVRYQFFHCYDLLFDGPRGSDCADHALGPSTCVLPKRYVTVPRQVRSCLLIVYYVLAHGYWTNICLTKRFPFHLLGFCSHLVKWIWFWI